MFFTLALPSSAKTINTKGRADAVQDDKRKAYLERTRERRRLQDQARYMLNREKRLQQKREWYTANCHSEAEKARQRRAENPDANRASVAKWASKNRHKIVELAATRRARVARAKPYWADQWVICQAYELAKMRELATGIKWDVDHIVPLKSDHVCGLHNEFNLQVIPRIRNKQKSNKIEHQKGWAV